MPSHNTSTAEPALEMRLELPITRSDVAEALAVAAEKLMRDRVAADHDEQVISIEEAVAMTPWTASGFKRVATKENLPFVKGPHKSPPGYRRGAVIEMLRRMQIWPKGRPAELVALRNAA